MQNNMVVGRFAPSPTGPLHFGSLIAALASFCEAHQQQGKWLVRMEDLDKPREVKGAADIILRQLEAFGFTWHGPVVYQSQRHEYYAAALEFLSKHAHIYPCTCTRKEIADASTQIGIEGVIYPGTCLQHPIKPNKSVAWRIHTPEQTICFNDEIQGKVCQTLSEQIGDFILKRADNLFAYQLAVVVDDAAQGITHIVRGADLLDSTPRQIFLQQQLGYKQPAYAHVPVACNTHGEKLSKQTLAKALDAQDAPLQLWQALAFLGQRPPQFLQFENLQTIWQWIHANWKLSHIPKQKSILLATD